MEHRDAPGSLTARPQSNQRGIETELGAREQMSKFLASIEPAWD